MEALYTFHVRIWLKNCSRVYHQKQAVMFFSQKQKFHLNMGLWGYLKTRKEIRVALHSNKFKCDRPVSLINNEPEWVPYITAFD